MTALELIQEAAKRVGIMEPAHVPLGTAGSTTYDYDANLLVSCLNGAIKQLMVLNLFNQSVLFSKISFTDASGFVDFSDITDPSGKFSDFTLNMTQAYPDFEELIGDGYTMSANNKKFLFRQLTSQDFIRVAKTTFPLSIESKRKTDWEREIREYRKNMPSEDRTDIEFSKKLESGFYMYAEPPATRKVYFCNNFFTVDDIAQNDWTLTFAYRSNYGVIDGTLHVRKLNVTVDSDTLVIPDELAILGTIIKYKSYYGLDFSLELGEQKAMIDALKENQENIQITHLDKKIYNKINPLI
jgi:hypothetical protein